MFVWKNNAQTISYSPEKCSIKVELTNDVWQSSAEPYLLFSDGRKVPFTEAEVSGISAKKTGIGYGVRADYRIDDITVSTYLWSEDANGDIHFEADVYGESEFQIEELAVFPPFLLGCEKDGGYTAIPRMQGALYPAGSEIPVKLGRIYDRPAYMSFYGQVRHSTGSGYITIIDTAFDSCYRTEGDSIWTVFVPSLGKIGYKRSIIMNFSESCSYVTICKKYRKYLSERGRLRTLREKAAFNPKINLMPGRVIVNPIAQWHVQPDSHYYKPGEPEKNDRCTTFDEIGDRMEKIYQNGLKEAYLHLDGWGKRGYDNLHPDILPPSEAAGGTEGMIRLMERVKKLGWLFGLHDNYRDYYLDAESYDEENSVMLKDGSRDRNDFWPGGSQTMLCAKLAPYYVRRNYEKLRELGIDIDGSYLDVFTVAQLDECFDPHHRMTRKECAEYRVHCYDVLNSMGIISSSEEVLDAVLPGIALCHFAPFHTEHFADPNDTPSGIPVPLCELVYHDCIITPWYGIRKRGGFCIPGNDCGFMYATLYGDTMGIDDELSAEDAEYIKPLLEMHKKLAFSEMLDHEFIDGSLRRQRTRFANGITVEIDMDEMSRKIYDADGKVIL